MFRKVKVAALVGLLLASGFLTFGSLRRAEAGITGKVTINNNTGERVDVYVNGSWWGTLNPGGFVQGDVRDASNDVTKLYAKDLGGTEWFRNVPENVNNPTWDVNLGGRQILH